MFPIITLGNWHTQEGNIYMLYEDGFWYQNVNYLAAVPTQYNCTTYEEQFNKLISRIESGALRTCKQSGKPYKMLGDTLYLLSNKTAQNALSKRFEGD